MTKPSFPRGPVIAAGLFGLSGVSLGAMGAHRLGPLLAQRGMVEVWETGARYHLLHAIALLAIAALIRQAGPTASRLLGAAGWGWSIGVILFSGSLYWFALGGPRWLVYATPLGGVALIIGWVLLVGAAIVKQRLEITDDR